MRLTQLLGVLVTVSAVFAARKKLPSFIRKCSNPEPQELNKCALERARDVLQKLIPGSRELKLPPLDPFKVERVSLNNNGFNLEFFDMDILSLSQLNITDTTLDLKSGRLEMKGYNPVGIVKSKYKSTGRLLGLPFSGGGNCSFKFHDMDQIYWMKFKREKNPTDGIDDVVIYDSSYTFEPSKVEFWFENLLFGDETLSNAANKVLNDNWRDVFEETRVSIFQILDEVTTNELRQVFKDVSYEDVFPV